MNNGSLTVCPFCVAGRPGCEYGASLFWRGRQIVAFLPERWPDVPTLAQVAALEEWYQVGDLYCAHIGQPVGRDRGV